MKNQYAKRKDANQNEVDDALRDAGWFVFDTSRLGLGYPDSVAASGCNPPLTILVETKMPGAKLSPAEKVFHQHFPGAIMIVNSGACAVTRANEIRAQHLGNKHENLV